MAAAALGSLSFCSTRVLAKTETPKWPTNSLKLQPTWVQRPWKTTNFPAARRPCMLVRPMATPDQIAEKVAESIKQAEETCAGGADSGECAAAWDEVEEVSAAASHARERQKEMSDPLENYCKDNPETKECRTYDN